MKKTILLATALISVLLFGACSKAPSPLIAQAERLQTELAPVATDSPMYLDSITVKYADAVLTVTIAFADPAVNPDDYSQALVEYVVAQYLKSHPGADLDAVLNGLSEEEGSLDIVLAGRSGAPRTYTIGSRRLKQLFRLRPMELNFNEVKTNVSSIMAGRCNQYRLGVNAAETTFAIDGGFAQYTLTFASPSAFSNQSQGSIVGRYLPGLREQYESYGACRPMIEETLRSLGIDGYRFVYTTAEGEPSLRAAVPWRMLN